MGDPGVDVNDIGGLDGRYRAVCLEHGHVWELGEVVSCPGGQSRIAFDGLNPAGRAGTLRHDCRVIPRSSADVNDVLPRLDIGRGDEPGVQGWLPVVNPALLDKPDNLVHIDVNRVGIGRLPIASGQGC